MSRFPWIAASIRAERGRARGELCRVWDIKRKTGAVLSLLLDLPLLRPPRRCW